uniref:Ubiquitin-like protease family profile domain-containing protein n=1 Tax=Chenopodium quinoa TaxID=63459 RepID=A0A803N9N0_CHEQI
MQGRRELVGRLVGGDRRSVEGEGLLRVVGGLVSVDGEDIGAFDELEEGIDGEGESTSSSGIVENLMMEYMKQKSRKRRLNGEGSQHRRKVRTLEGNKVLSKGEVLKTHHDNVGQYSNIVCRVESFSVSVSAFDTKRKELVRRMGFGALLELDMKNIPRQFCYWLMARVREDATMVRCVLGIPMGSKPVPMDIGEDEEKIMLVKSMYDAYGTGPKKETISLKAASSVLCPLGTDQKHMPLLTEIDEEEFMVAFFIVVLGKLLCTTTNSSNLASSLIPCVTVASHANEYDWCTFTMDWLCDTARRFQSKFMRDGYRSGCGGSFLFVMIFYLDHLHWKPLKWGVFPRVTVWNSVEIRATLMEDKVTRDEYGKLLAYDIAYGEEHPLVTRDDDCVGKDVSPLTNNEQMNDMLTDVVDKMIAKFTPKLETLVEGVVEKCFSSFVSKMTGMGLDRNLDDLLLIQVFVPVLVPQKNAEHWFCLALELKSQRIWMIDFMYDDLFCTHEAIVEILVKALEVLLQISNPMWVEGTVESWLRRVFPVQQSDTSSCGALMLATIKHCARSFEAELHLDTIAKVRKNLFLEDVYNDFNEVRANLESDILPKERRDTRRTGSQHTC